MPAAPPDWRSHKMRSTVPTPVRPVSVRLHREDSARLDRLRRATGLGQSELFREALRILEEVRRS